MWSASMDAEQPDSSAPQAIDMPSAAEILNRIPVRLKALPLYLTAYSLPADAVVLLALAGILGLALWLRRLRLSWPMLTPIIGLLVVYAIVPEQWARIPEHAYADPDRCCKQHCPDVDGHRESCAALGPILALTESRGGRDATTMRRFGYCG